MGQGPGGRCTVSIIVSSSSGPHDSIVRNGLGTRYYSILLYYYFEHTIMS